MNNILKTQGLHQILNQMQRISLRQIVMCNEFELIHKHITFCWLQCCPIKSLIITFDLVVCCLSDFFIFWWTCRSLSSHSTIIASDLSKRGFVVYSVYRSSISKLGSFSSVHDSSKSSLHSNRRIENDGDGHWHGRKSYSDLDLGNLGNNSVSVH